MRASASQTTARTAPVMNVTSASWLQTHGNDGRQSSPRRFPEARSDHVYDGGNYEDTDCQHQDFGEVETRDY